MAVDLATDPGGLFRRWGKLEDHRAKTFVNVVQVDTEVDDTLDQYNDDRDFAIPLQENVRTYKSGAVAAVPDIATVARKTMLEMMEADDPLPTGEVTPEGALRRLVDQMTTSSDSIDGTTITIGTTTALSGNVGNGTFILHDENVNGEEMHTPRTETMVMECVSDAQSGGSATAGQELFEVRGEPAASNPNSSDPLWPGGSGANKTMKIAAASVQGSTSRGRNMLTNSDFETFA